MGKKPQKTPLYRFLFQVLTFLPYPPAILFFRVLWWLLFCSVQFLVVISGGERKRLEWPYSILPRARIGIHIFNALVLQMNWQWRILRHLEKFPIWETNTETDQGTQKKQNEAARSKPKINIDGCVSLDLRKEWLSLK